MSNTYHWTPGHFSAETVTDRASLAIDLIRFKDYFFIQGQSLASLLEKKNVTNDQNNPELIVATTEAIIKETLLDRLPEASNEDKKLWAKNITQELSQKGIAFLAINSLKSEFTPMLQDGTLYHLRDKEGDTSRSVSIELDGDNKLSVLSTGAIHKSLLMPAEIENPPAPDGLPWVKAFARTNIDLGENGAIKLAKPQCSLYFNQTKSYYRDFLLNPDRNELRLDPVDIMNNIKPVPAASPELMLKVKEYQQMLSQFKQDLTTQHHIRPAANQNGKPTLAEQQIAIIDESLKKIEGHLDKSQALDNSMTHLTRHAAILEKNHPLSELKITQLVKALFQRFFSSKNSGQKFTDEVQNKHEQFINFKKAFQTVGRPGPNEGLSKPDAAPDDSEAPSLRS